MQRTSAIVDPFAAAFSNTLRTARNAGCGTDRTGHAELCARLILWTGHQYFKGPEAYEDTEDSSVLIKSLVVVSKQVNDETTNG